MSLLEAEAHDASASFLSQQDIDDELRRGSGFAHGKSRIFEFYQSNPDAKTAAEFLKQEYGTGGHSVAYRNGASGLIDYNAKGLHLRQWGDAPGITLTWTQVHRRIAELIQSDQYLTDAEKTGLHEERLEPEATEPVLESETVPISIIPAKNFRITDDALGVGGPKAKYAMNIAAIRALNQIESEHRQATLQEQEILSRYVGWGGVADAFDETKASWQGEYRELQDLLTDEEYTSARESVLNAHYTSPTVIKAIYAALERMGFTNGNVLEPACGIGNFFGLVPDSMADSHFYGVELDSITGRIAKMLYPENDITIQGFEEADQPDSFFDAAVGNVPFGDYGVADKRYDRHHFLIHDYFFAKALDKVRPGGIVAFITSSGTMDKKNPSVRRYLAQRADLIGAVRLPNNAFLANAGTTVVADILFLQKRDRPIEIEPDWVHLGTTPDGITINQYFVDNPDMILGELTTESTQYGRQECTVKPVEGAVLADQLHDALSGLHAELTEFVPIDDLEEADSGSIPADPDVRNFSFTIVDGEIYYRENSRMSKVDASVTAGNRIRGMIELRDCTRRLIEFQLNGHPDAEIITEQARLNELFDAFAKKYGLINSRGNNMAFSDDSSYCLLCSLEVLDEEGNLARKADMFTKRTIRQQIDITHVDTPSEALAVSLGEKARVDLPYMAELTGMSEEQIAADLTGVIFRDYGTLVPANIAWAFFDPAQFPMVTADDYLSGNVREKLRQVRQLREMLSGHGVDASVLSQVDSNIAALEKTQPSELTASEIDVRLGSTWVPPEIVEEFMYELFQTGGWARSRMHVQFSGYTANWTVTNKSSDYGSVPATVTYGTSRASGYRILEDTLNLRDVRIFDTVRDPDGKEQRVLNKKETVLAQQKQQLIKNAFSQWIWKDAVRREQLTTLYNERFNSTRPREYDGSHIRFVGMNPEITLRQHQADSVARNIRLEPSKIQRELVAGLAERAERVRNQMVDPSVDNMLTITNDGRKLALDQRLLNPALPDDPRGKVGACLDNVFRIWNESQTERLTQLVFCDLSTPKGDREFSVYDDLKKKLIELGVPAKEIAFIHDANTETKKTELFAKVRSGQVRILLGSTPKMGSGTNVQRLLYAEHHLDIPWRPADLEQREGRAIRQGNTCSAVHIYRYVTEGTFDAYMWATLENKQKFIGQIMTSKSPVRSCEDVDETALTYAEVKALATGDERIKEKMDLEVDVAKLKLVRANYLTQKYALEDALLKRFPQEIRRTQERISGDLSDIERFAAHVSDKFLGMELNGTIYPEKKDAGAALLAACRAQTSPEPKQIGTYCGFDLFLSFDALSKSFRLTLKGALSHTVELGDDLFGNIQRIDNTLRAMPERLATARQTLADLEQQRQAAEKEVKQSFSQEQELNDKCARLAQLDAELNIDKGRGEGESVLDDSTQEKSTEREPDDDIEEKPSVKDHLRAFSRVQEHTAVLGPAHCVGLEER